jgi:hypothetical protein
MKGQGRMPLAPQGLKIIAQGKAKPPPWVKGALSIADE